VTDPMLTEDRLPPEVADLLRDAARARTAGSAPFPRMHRAIRRDRRRRAAGGTAVAIAAVVAATVATGVVGPDRAAPPPAKRVATPTPPPRTPEPGPDSNPYHLAGRTAGALGSDSGWIQGMRERLARERKLADPAHARVLWAADHKGSRFALMITENKGNWLLENWAGDAGAAPAAMRWSGGSAMSGPGAALEQRAEASVSETFRPSRVGDGLAVVVGEGLSHVEVASRFDYSADGRKTATWRPLAPEAAVWITEATEAEMDGMTYRGRTSDGEVTRVGGGGTYEEDDPKVDVGPVSPAGSDPEVLACATMAFASEQGGMPEGSTPILGGTPTVGAQWYGIAVARAPGGGYLVGSCPTLHPEWSNSNGSEGAAGFVVPAPAGGPDELFVLVPTHQSEAVSASTTLQHPVAVVVAPVGATEVEVAGKTVPVRDRLAVVTGIPEAGPTAIARDASGRELGRTGPAREEREVEQRSLYGCPARGGGPYCGGSG
jgi:hypothetical protein